MIIGKIKEHEHKKFSDEVNAIKAKLQVEYSTKLNEISKHYSQKLERDLSKRSSKLKKELKAQYDAKLKEELWGKKAEIDRKKAEIEKHVIEQAKKLFG